MSDLINPNPIIYEIKRIDESSNYKRKRQEEDEDYKDEVDRLESNL